MVPKKNILLRRTVVLSLIGVGLIVTIGISLVFRSSIQRDAEHIRFVGISGDVENGILKVRICIDEILLRNDYNTLPQLRQSLDSVKYNLEALNTLFTSKFIHSGEDNLKSYKAHYNDITEKLAFLEKQIYKNGDLRLKVSDTLLFEGFKQFNMSYRQFESFLPRYILMDANRYKQEVFGLVFMNLIIAILAGFFILKLSNQLIQVDRNIVKKTIEVENRERERIAADLHDGLGSLLSGLIIHLQILEKENEHNSAHKEKLKHLSFLSNHALQSIEEVINNLNPSLLSRYGLVKSLQKIVQKINELGKTQFRIDAERLNVQFPKSTEVMMYRICNELINNALRHSCAKNAEFTFFNNKKQVHLVYKDNGIGFASEVRSYEDQKSGLYNLMRRVEAMEGICRIESEPNKGVKIDIQFIII